MSRQLQESQAMGTGYRRIGVFGGMGPQATVDFMDKLVRETPATCDQEHIPVVVASLPHTPDRSRRIMGGGDDPLPSLLQGIDLLNHIGVGVVAIPCNSSHHWYPQMAERSHAPVIHIAEAAVASIDAAHTRRVAVLATRGALASGFYQRALQARGIECIVPDASAVQPDIDACIQAVKAGDVAEGRRRLADAYRSLEGQGATAAIMGCTEIPVANVGLETPLALADSSLALARAAVAHALARGWNRST